MIGNNACGSRALGYGRTSDNVVGLDVRHRRRRAAATGRRPAAGGLDALRALVGGAPGDDPHRAGPVRPAGLRLRAGTPAARARLRRGPGAGRQRGHARASCSARPSGWSPTPRTGRWWCSATRRWPTPPTPTPALLPHSPAAVEGLDARIVQRLRDVPAAVVPDLPARRGLADRRTDRRQRRARSRRTARRVLADAGALTPSSSPTRPRRRRSGGSARTAPGSPPAPATAGRRTPAGRTPPSRRSGWAPTCASSTRCSPQHGLQGVPYGHFGDGCVHVRIDFPFGPGEPAAAPRTAPSSRTPPGWSPATAARCPASTATAGPAASCCR